ncbi:MAG: glucose 1-dehydrogenase [Gammaproteobacteria bacterium]|nr:glucose 1-dehydrogenase [Gammaproteobacteria bacterium]
MTARFANQTVLITGGGSGIGQATALAFAREGAAVVIAGRREAPLADTVKLIQAANGTASLVLANVADPADVARMVETCVQRHGGLQIAFNNAGTVGKPGPLADLDETLWSEMIATNLTGIWLSMKYEIKQMQTHGGGSIVNMAANIGAHTRRPGLGAYAATKAAVSALTRNAAREYIADGIRINAVSPGATDTPLSRRPGETHADRDARIKTVVPLGRVGTTEEVAAAVLWLAAPESSFVVGHDLVVDGGATA